MRRQGQASVEPLTDTLQLALSCPEPHATHHLRRRHRRVRRGRRHAGRAPGRGAACGSRSSKAARASTRAPTSTPTRCRSTSPTGRFRRCGRARPGSTRSAAAASAARRCCGTRWRCGSASATSRGGRHEGAGEDWPIDYKDIAPYYDTIEREVGVCGNLDGLEDLPDGVFLPPVPLKCSDQILQRAARIARRDADPRPEGDAARCRRTTRPACHFCGNCMAGCDVVAKYNSADVHIAPAEKTGRVTVFSDCIVREVLVSDENRATGVALLPSRAQARGRSARPMRGRGVRVRPERRAAADVDVAPLSDRPGELERAARPALHPALHRRDRVRARRSCAASRATNDEGFLDHAYLPSFMHNAEARLRAQLRRAAQLPEPPARGLGEDRRRLRPRPTRRR